ncbi:nucleotidyltransferase domain-containing protein [Streptomyces finlayi]|uniref:Nucleotidyltransferase domain-containing protein n=1 Tax=Streptomyces finlayi TaxID=67296 RepID=A0A7G7BGG6_9ACTN|nr:nucleotidyltransferase domain-containing protein [Streptomyces finlayi]QNE74431.1 nucleotidyltransferase domain-containing protein [Streptomyces finlayi]
MDPVVVARAVVEKRYPVARAAFLGGSVLTERRTALSDLDIVVLLHGPPAPYRESLQYGDWPVELFVHTEESWHAFVDREIRKRRSPLLWMCADGELLFDVDGLGVSLAAEARKLALAGPPAATVEEIEDFRYSITDLLDDLAGCTDEGERLFIASELARRAGELALALGGAWGGGGKWLARRLADAAPGLNVRLHHAVRGALNGQTEALVGVVDDVLARAGGRLWVGYRRSGTP